MNRCVSCPDRALDKSLYCNAHHIAEIIRLRRRISDLDVELRQARRDLWWFSTSGVDWKDPSEPTKVNP